MLFALSILGRLFHGRGNRRTSIAARREVIIAKQYFVQIVLVSDRACQYLVVAIVEFYVVHLKNGFAMIAIKERRLRQIVQKQAMVFR